MRRPRWWLWATVLLLAQAGWGASPIWADPPDQATPGPEGSSSIFSQWVKRSDSKPADAKTQPVDPPKPADPKPDAAKQQAQAARNIVAERQRARSDYYRWLKVCDQLQAVADRSGDQALAAEASELSDRAGKIYEARLARLPMPHKAAPAAPKKQAVAAAPASGF